MNTLFVHLFLPFISILNNNPSYKMGTHAQFEVIAPRTAGNNGDHTVPT